MAMEPENLDRVHIWITGRVQGVGFRAFMVENARSLGLVGWVRNVGWNQVEAIAEGDRLRLENWIEAAKMGPPGSRVEETRLEWEKPTREFKHFEVAYNR